VLTRLFALAGDPKAARLNARLWTLAGALVAAAAQEQQTTERSCSDLNQALMELGATVCTPAQPACAMCPLTRHCRARALGKPEAFPQTRRRPQTRTRRFAALVLSRGNRFLVRQRPPDGVNAGFWEFPNIELTANGDARAGLANWLKLPQAALTATGTLRHAITHHRITQEIFRATTRRTAFPALPNARWVTFAELDQLHLTGSHRRLARSL